MYEVAVEANMHDGLRQMMPNLVFGMTRVGTFFV